MRHCFGLAMAAMGRHNAQSRCGIVKCTENNPAVENSKLWGLCMPDLAAASLATQLGMLLSVTALVPLTSSKPCRPDLLLTGDVDRAQPSIFYCRHTIQEHIRHMLHPFT